jgi:SNF2 family DNA or RNA helicase
MNISTEDPFQLIYSLYQHEYLGYIFNAFVVQLNQSGQLTLKHQNISSKNAREFASGLNETDYQLIHLTDGFNQETIVKKFYNKRISPIDFFLKVYDAKKGDKALQEAIDKHIEFLKASFLKLATDKPLFIMGNDGNPAWKSIEQMPDKVSVLFHFYRNENDTHYFPTLKYKGERLEFQFKNALILCNEPATLLIGNKLYGFGKDLDGKKLKPFLQKKFISIPRNVEEEYYKKFVAPLIASFDVSAKGFEIRQEKFNPLPILIFSEWAHATQPKLVLFDGEEEEEAETGEIQQQITFDLSFQYGSFVFKTDYATQASVTVEKTLYSYIFHKVQRNVNLEHQKLDLLRQLGLDIRHGKETLTKTEAFSWMDRSYQLLKEAGFIIRQSSRDDKRYFLGKSEISIEINENRDWFDIYTVVRFGEFEIPFMQLRRLILDKKQEFILPNGEIAVIPEAWFTQYSELFAFSQPDTDDTYLTLQKYHLALVQSLHDGELARLTIGRKLEKLRDFEKIEDYSVPQGFNGTLRPYQKAGYNWMMFLNQYRFGGCLADDMGLGKTIMTLTLLQAQKETAAQTASMVVMPTSLIYNWELEAAKFTPQLRILNYTGTHREKNISLFQHFDVILTSYGIVRMDIEMLKTYPFHYVILDESQAIKNPGSNIAQSVVQLKAKHKLILTGTPLENSTLDLWSQMTFINPGLLGNLRFFKNEFQIPIEKKNDELKIQKLFTIIKPFILRRHKSQVATELPEKIENIQYSPMTEEQEKAYEEAKSYFRNSILKQIDEQGIAKSQLLVLQGLTALRQLANHPRMVNPDFEGQSGKMQDVTYKLKTIIEEKHKILIFSQFVKHLSLFRALLDREQVPYAYLDGSTKYRQEQVEQFQQREDLQVFLLSLKAGGLGLNLTAAEYVFILDPWWNPAIENQAVDRAYRIGQKNTVFTYKFITKNSVEEKILALQQSKRKLFQHLITTEENFVKSLTKEDIISLLV